MFCPPYCVETHLHLIDKGNEFEIVQGDSDTSVCMCARDQTPNSAQILIASHMISSLLFLLLSTNPAPPPQLPAK